MAFMRPEETNGAPVPKDAAPPGGARKGSFCSPDSPYASRARRWKPFAALIARNHRPGSLRRMASMRSQMALAAASGSIPA